MYSCFPDVYTIHHTGNYDVIQQPKNVSKDAKKHVPFYMFIDGETEKYMKRSGVLGSSKRIGIWKIIVVRNTPNADARRNGKTCLKTGFSTYRYMQAQKEAPASMQCKDKFLVQSVIAPETTKDLAAEMFNKDEGKLVEEFKLRLIYIPANPPSQYLKNQKKDLLLGQLGRRTDIKLLLQLQGDWMILKEILQSYFPHSAIIFCIKSAF
ncbi:hypothetical protein V2J09_011013 [Rumex salicifolius]